MSTELATAQCRTCGHTRPAADFYEASGECRSCKRERSQRNRATAAQKIALADRLIDLLTQLVSQGWCPPLLGDATKDGLGGRCNRPTEPSTGPQEVLS